MRLCELVVSEAATPAMLFHGSLHAFDLAEVRPLTHFGTRRAAAQRMVMFGQYKRLPADTPVYLTPARLRVDHPLRIRDGKKNTHNVGEIAMTLFYTLHVIDRTQYRDLVDASAHEDPAAPAMLIALMKAKGYDGFVYRNKYEDAGKDSYVIFDAAQASPAGEPIHTTLGAIDAE